MDPRVEKLADVLVHYSVAVKPGEWVMVDSEPLAEPLVNAVVAAVLRAGGHPTAFFLSQETQETVLRMASEEQLKFVSPLEKLVAEQVDVTIGIMAPRNTKALASSDPAKLAVMNKAREPMMETFMRRTAEGTLRWTGTAYPTPAGAQDASMSLHDYESFVYGAGLLGEADPVADWRQLGERQQRIADWLSDKKTVHVEGPGSDLTVGIAGRTWLNDDGHFNFPGGEISTGPV